MKFKIYRLLFVAGFIKDLRPCREKAFLCTVARSISFDK